MNANEFNVQAEDKTTNYLSPDYSQEKPIYLFLRQHNSNMFYNPNMFGLLNG